MSGLSLSLSFECTIIIKYAQGCCTCRAVCNCSVRIRFANASAHSMIIIHQQRTLARSALRVASYLQLKTNDFLKRPQTWCCARASTPVCWFVGVCVWKDEHLICVRDVPLPGGLALAYSPKVHRSNKSQAQTHTMQATRGERARRTRWVVGLEANWVGCVKLGDTNGKLLKVMG